jgi:hypothetical protein
VRIICLPIFSLRILAAVEPTDLDICWPGITYSRSECSYCDIATLLDGDGSRSRESLPKSKDTTSMKSANNVVGRPVFLSVREVGWALGVPTWVVHRAIRVGTLPAVRRRSRLVVAETDLQRLRMAGGAS